MKLKDVNLCESVLTTKFVIKENSKIVNVVRDAESMWEFYGDDFLTMADVMIVCVKDILEVDSSLGELELGLNEEAYLQNGKWIVSVYDEYEQN